jgi:UDP-N-acetylmuramoyl-L-alanyl-D-glutamate--2,6-diaminopimelate ligase
MIDTILGIIRKFVPKDLYRKAQPAYHYLMALAGAVVYRFPSRKVTVIAVTGTKGKTTVSELIHNCLRAAGHTVALSNTIHFIIDGKEERNLYKMSMPGRMFMQRFLRRAVNAGCEYVVIEATSEGSKFFRHRFMALDALVFTNLSPEHIESHGSFENYRAAKVDIAKQLARGGKKRTVLIVNGEDEASPYFLAEQATEKNRFFLSDAEPFRATPKGIEFTWHGVDAFSPLTGDFNLRNVVAALTACHAFGIDEAAALRGIKETQEVKGRVERVDRGQPFEVIVDYAHTVESLEALYGAFAGKRIVALLGNTGGGRDVWKRPAMAQTAAKHATKVILANEDPYEEDPMKIVTEMANAIPEAKPEIILDRRAAIAAAIRHAQQAFSVDGKPTAVLITGKGTDPYLMEANGKRTPWSDSQVAAEELDKLYR